MPEYGLVGERLEHSYSPQIHAMMGDYAYRLYSVAPDKLAEFLQTAPFDGLNVTIPYKKTVIAYCDALCDKAKAIGSVNTLVRRDGKLTGYNTDCFGFEALLKKAGVEMKNRKVLVLGSGGASLAVQYVLKNHGANTVVISRSGTENYETVYRHTDAVVIVNATPVGMFPHTAQQPIKLDAFSHCEAVLDLIYNPSSTQLLLDAKRRGMIALNGLTMLAAQALRASELFLQTQLPTERIDEICKIIAKRMQNIILIGMPGSGKTTVGRRLAELTGREFFDCDAVISQHTGKSVPDIFAEDGEATFRVLETQVLRSFCASSGKIIATGGGVVTTPENLDILRQNGVIVFLDRPPGELPSDGRPLTEQYGAAALASTRLPLYQSWCDYRIAVDGVEKTAYTIRRELEL